MTQAFAPEWWFYHLERSGLEWAAPPLIEKCLMRDWRVLAVSAKPATRAQLDEALWTFRDDSFLAHGEAGAAGLDPARQPVLIAAEPDNLNAADAILLLDGTQMEALVPFQRCMVMFDAGETATRDIARAQFKAAKDAGLPCRYFQQTANGGWKEAGS